MAESNTPGLMDPLADSLHLGGDRRDAFLLLHGWTGSPAHFRPAARFLHERGYAVSVPRLAGHGTSVHDMADTGWRDWVRSALDGFYGLAAGYDRVHVAGLSMGGVISLLLAATCDVASVTTINAPQHLHDWRADLTRLLRGSHRIRRGDSDPPPPPDLAHYWVQYDDSPLGTLPELLDLIDAAQRALPRIRVPAVVIQSRADETVHYGSAEIIYARLGSPDKRIVWLERSRHVALLDAERDRIHQELLAQAQRGA